MELFNISNENYEDGVILAVSNSYDKLYYFNDDFETIPEQVKRELQVMMVMHTEEVGGIFVLGFDKEGKLFLETEASDFDAYYDEIGSHLKIKEYLWENKELFAQLEAYYENFF